MPEVTTKEETWLDIIHRESSILLRVSEELQSLSQAFYTIGNGLVGYKLEELAKLCLISSKEVSRATCLCLTEEVRRSQEATANILKTALAVAARDSKSRESKLSKEKK